MQRGIKSARPRASGRGNDSSTARAISVLRVAVALEFLGHGFYALTVKPAWVPFVTVFGFSAEAAPTLMRAVGVLDWLLALCLLVRPLGPLLLWMTFWGFFTATLRPITGDSLFEFIERGPNWGAPLALFLLVRAHEKALRQQPAEAQASP